MSLMEMQGNRTPNFVEKLVLLSIQGLSKVYFNTMTELTKMSRPYCRIWNQQYNNYSVCELTKLFNHLKAWCKHYDCELQVNYALIQCISIHSKFWTVLLRLCSVAIS